MNYIKLTFSGVLQYFSDTDSSTIKSTYNTALHPTKTAIIGLIASALGYNRNDPRSAELANSVDIKYSIIKNPTILTDFQTVRPLKSQSRYMNKFYKNTKFDTFSKLNDSDKSIIKRVQYLQDAEFDVYVGGNDELLNTIFKAIQNPVYTLFIGKRSCVPNKPIVTDFNLIKEEDLTDVYNCA